MSFLTPVRCSCRKVIQVEKFMKEVNRQKEQEDFKEVDYEYIFDVVFKNKLLPCCKPKYLNIESNIKKENILLSYETE